MLSGGCCVEQPSKRATINNKLAAIEQLAQRFPDLRDRIERVVGCALEAIVALQRQPNGIEAVADIAESTLKIRSRRNEAFGVDLFRDPAWDMLLDLYVSETRGRTTHVSSLCIAGNVPMTTGLRYVDALEHCGLVRKREDPHDHRRILVSASPRTIDVIDMLMKDAFRPS